MKSCPDCAEQVQDLARVCRYCGHRFDAPDRAPGRGKRWWLTGAVAVAALVVIALYTTGRLDRPLSNVGLNLHACAENVFGSKLCGDQLVAYCKRQYNANSNGDVCDTALRDAGLDPAAIERKRTAQEADERRGSEYEDCLDEAEAGLHPYTDCAP